MGSRYLSKTALFGPKTRSSAMSPLRHRSLFGAEKCAKRWRFFTPASCPDFACESTLFGAEKCAMEKASSCGSTGILIGGYFPSILYHTSNSCLTLAQASSCGRGVPSAFDRHFRPIHRLMPSGRFYRTLRHFGQFIASCQVGVFILHFQFSVRVDIQS